MGVPASRVSVPSARSAATLAPTFTNVADMMPLAMIPAVKYCRNGHPGGPDRAVEHLPEHHAAG